MRSVIAVIAGWLIAVVVYHAGAVIALLVTVGIPLGASPGQMGPRDFVTHLALGSIAALVAGWTTARVARGPRPAFALALLLAAFAVWGFGKPGSHWPAWYPWTLALVAIGGILAGAALGGHLGSQNRST